MTSSDSRTEAGTDASTGAHADAPISEQAGPDGTQARSDNGAGLPPLPVLRPLLRLPRLTAPARPAGWETWALAERPAEQPEPRLPDVSAETPDGPDETSEPADDDVSAETPDGPDETSEPADDDVSAETPDRPDETSEPAADDVSAETPDGPHETSEPVADDVSAETSAEPGAAPPTGEAAEPEPGPTQHDREDTARIPPAIIAAALADAMAANGSAQSTGAAVPPAGGLGRRHRRRAQRAGEAAPTGTEAPAADTAAADVPGRRALVIGGSGTVGAAIARALAAAGFRVAVHFGTGADRAGHLASALEGAGHLVIGADLADPDAVADLFRRVDAVFGGLDVVVDAARAVPALSVVESSAEQWADGWSAALSVNLLGAATVIRLATQTFLARHHPGRIVLVAGRGGDDAGSPVALTTAAAVTGLAASLAEELRPHGIGVTVVGAGSSGPSGAAWSAVDLAATVVWLVSAPTGPASSAVLTLGV